MRAIWKGAISFGMVTIPVKLYTATEQKDVRLRLLHKQDGAPIEEKRFCTADGKEVAWDDLQRGYEIGKGEFVILDPEEIDDAKPESSTTIEIGDFVEAEEIDPIYFEKSYFLEPTDVGAKPFSLLKRALEETDRVALARVTIRTRERLAILRPYEDTLLLETMFWPDEIRSTGALDLPEGDETEVRAKELEMARSLSHCAGGAHREEDARREAQCEAAQDRTEGDRPDGSAQGERRRGQGRPKEDDDDAQEAGAQEGRESFRGQAPRGEAFRSEALGRLTVAGPPLSGACDERRRRVGRSLACGAAQRREARTKAVSPPLSRRWFSITTAQRRAGWATSLCAGLTRPGRALGEERRRILPNARTSVISGLRHQGCRPAERGCGLRKPLLPANAHTTSGCQAAPLVRVERLFRGSRPQRYPPISRELEHNHRDNRRRYILNRRR